MGLSEQIAEWRGSPDLHTKNVMWVYGGGSGAPGAAMNAGWGMNGKLHTKAVLCEEIPAKFHYYDATTGTNAVEDVGADKELAEEVLEVFRNTCSLSPLEDPDRPCPTSDTKAPASTCVMSTAHYNNLTSCSQSTGVWGDSSGILDIQSDLDKMLKGCAQVMCDTYVEGGIVVQNAAGAWTCEPNAEPTSCNIGANYMEALQKKSLCDLESYRAMSIRKLGQAASNIEIGGADAAAAAAACEGAA